MRYLLLFSLLLTGVVSHHAVHAQCTAAFEFFNGNQILQIQFHDLSDDDPDIVSWHWNFGDGHMSDQQNPLYTYAAPGTYLVCLVVENELGCVNDVCHEVIVLDQTCEAAFEWEASGLVVNFIDNSDDDPDIASWSWNFGDGHTSNEANPVHTYAEPGVYVVCLTIVNEFNCTDNICHELHVTESPAVCEAEFEWFNANGNLQIQFHDLSDDDPDIVSWHWNLGDGHMSEQEHPLHTYEEPGVYLVCLIVENELGCISDVCYEVHVGESTGSCEVDFQWFDGNANLQIQFYDLSDDDPDIVSWHWNFGDGHMSDQQHPLHTYAEPGVYLVCLTVENEFGCASDICHGIHVTEGSGTCEAAFEWEGTGLVIQFIDHSHPGPSIVSWHWNFGDGHTSDEANPVHTYAQPGVYVVCLAVVSEIGCASDVCHIVHVGEGMGSCEAAFEWEASGLVVNFIDTSDDDPDIASWSWIFGDGHFSNETNPVHTYAEAGVYTVCLLVINEFGCAADICHQVTVEEENGGCEAAFEWYNGNENLQIQFHDLSDDDPDIVSWHWNFGDGHMSDQQNPLYTYAAPGTYLVCLVVENELGCVNDVCHEVIVLDQTCEAAFEWEASGLVVNFIDNSDDDPDIASWSWIFGDGHFSNEANPVHTYAEAGVYTVCLLVINEFGCAADICHQVEVGQGSGTCEAAFEWFPGNEIQQIHFHDLSDDDPDIVSWFWHFGDGHTSDQQHPLHTYGAGGVYLVCLAVVNEFGCVSDICHEVLVPQGIIVGLELNSEIGFAGPWDGLQGALSTRTDKHTNVSSSIFPNPAGQHITLHFELMQPSEISVHLFHAGGQVTAQSVNHIYPAGNNDLGINVDGYAPGIYYLRLHTKEGSWTGKFIKI